MNDTRQGPTGPQKIGETARPPILVTGLGRSGTSWVGRVLSAPHDVAYILEPFNPALHFYGQFGPRLPGFFTYMAAHNADRYAAAVEDMLAFRYQPLAGLRAVLRPTLFRHSVRSARRFRENRQLRRRPLIKDPSAVFSAPWLAERFAMRIVIMVRHPAAVAASFKRLDYPRVPFEHLLNQSALMQDRLEAFRSELETVAAQPDALPIVEQAALLWKVVNAVVADYRQEHPDWLILRNEDIARDPENHFRQLFETLDLSFSPNGERAVRARILRAEDAPPQNPYSTRRHPAAAIAGWHRILSTDEIDAVRRRTEPIASAFYHDDDWSPREQRDC